MVIHTDMDTKDLFGDLDLDGKSKHPFARQKTRAGCEMSGAGLYGHKRWTMDIIVSKFKKRKIEKKNSKKKKIIRMRRNWEESISEGNWLFV